VSPITRHRRTSIASADSGGSGSYYGGDGGADDQLPFMGLLPSTDGEKPRARRMSRGPDLLDDGYRSGGEAAGPRDRDDDAAADTDFFDDDSESGVLGLLG